MRLLQLQGDDQLRLVEYVGKDIPQYAILSHTWGADYEEVNFNDMKEATGKNKAGYYKLIFCGKQALADGLHFFWVDTCCIDKASSAELSEAINSMFQWYHKAAKCYAYLSDVSTTSPSQNNQSFRKSRWFTRGWTLQELIAPVSVEFFSAEGHYLGDKHSLQQTLHEITGIAIEALQGSPLSQFNVDERMSWAERRETKREEDAAYSLLGIFNICIPLIYGEGRERAFNRLRREIKEVLGDEKYALSSVSNVPFRRDPDFVHNGTLLDQVHTKCLVPASCVALVGLGGVGKSQIAIEYSYRVQENSPTTWVFWVHAGTRARFEEGYRRIAETTGMKGFDDPKADILRLVRGWLSNQRNGKWTMIIDNADDATVFSCDTSQNHDVDKLAQSVEPFLDFLPQSRNGSILITSRSRDVAYRLTGSHVSIIEVKAMNENDALSLLGRKLSSNTSKDNAIELIKTLDYMPLAITQAAAFIEQRAPRMDISRYLDELHRSDHDRARLLKRDVGDGRRDGGASNSIIATWQISFEYIRKHMPTAARLLSLMSLFDRQGIPESLLRDQYREKDDGNVDVDFDDDIHHLTSYALVEISANGKEFEMHRLVQFSTKKWLELNQELESWKEIYVKLIDDNYPAGKYENWTVCQALFPHTQTAVDCRPKDTNALGAWASVMAKAAWYASEMGQYNVAREMDRSALEAREATFGVEHPYTLTSVTNFGLALSNQGKHEEAEMMHRRASEGLGKMLGPVHIDTLISVSNLGSTLSKQGKYEEAEMMNRRASEGLEKVLGPEHVDTLISMSNLGSTLSNQGRYEEAEALYRRSIEGSEKVLGRKHPHTLSSVNNLGLLLSKQGKYKEAEAMYRGAIEGREKVLGPDHPNTLRSINLLGSALVGQGNYEEADAMYRRVLEARERALGPDHRDTLSSINLLGSVLEVQGKHVEAEAMRRRAL